MAPKSIAPDGEIVAPCLLYLEFVVECDDPRETEVVVLLRVERGIGRPVV